MLPWSVILQLLRCSGCLYPLTYRSYQTMWCTCLKCYIIILANVTLILISCKDPLWDMW